MDDVTYGDAPDETPGAPRTHKSRVVLVDDTEAVLALFRLTLSFHDDLEVVGEATDGAEAIEVARALQPDCVVLDWQMPVLDGPAAIPGIRQAAPEASVILFSNRFGPGAEATAVAAGADHFLEKQGDLSALVDAIRATCATV